MTPEERVLSELRKISKISALVNARVLETELSKYANTPERKRMWALIDGTRMPRQIAEEGNVSERTVNYFVTALRAADLIEYERGKPPKRLLDYVPANWVELAAPQTGVETSPEPTLATPQATLTETNTSAETSGGNSQDG